jgi:hypothetical protein
MAKRKARPKTKRATDHADFAGSKADKAEVKRLAAAGEAKNRKGRKKANGSSPGLPLTGGGNVGQPSVESVSRHIKDIRGAINRYNKASQTARDLKKVVNNYFKTAETDGLDIKALKKKFADENRPVGEVIAERRNIARYEKIDGGGIGTQWNLLNDEGVANKIDAYASGEHAGMNGEPRDNNPNIPGSDDAQRWSAGHAAGAAKADAVFDNARPPQEPPPEPEAA